MTAWSSPPAFGPPSMGVPAVKKYGLCRSGSGAGNRRLGLFAELIGMRLPLGYAAGVVRDQPPAALRRRPHLQRSQAYDFTRSLGLSKRNDVFG
jgi:hypothetical protein